MRWHADKLYICDYLPDGQTRDNRLVKRNPMGFAMMYNQNMLFQCGVKRNFYNAAQMIALSFYAGHIEYLKQSNKKVMTAAAFPVGVLLGIRRKGQFAKLD